MPFEPGFTAQLGTYMTIIDDTLRHPDDKPTIGLLICKTKKDVIVVYALRSVAVPIGVSSWAEQFTSQLPDELTVSLPSIEVLEAELTDPPTDPPTDVETS